MEPQIFGRYVRGPPRRGGTPRAPWKARGSLGRAERNLNAPGRAMEKYSEVFVGIDTAKKKHAVAIADAGDDVEARYLGEIDSAPATVERVIKKLASRYGKERVCYEVGPMGYGFYRQTITFDERTVEAPSLIRKKAGDRIKTNRRDARP